MNFVPCVTWVGKGIAKSCPDKLQLSPEELKRLIQETKDLSRKTENNELSDEEDSNDETKDTPQDSVSKKIEDNDEEDFDVRYNLENYDDDEGEDQPFINISDVTTFVDNKEDNYITDYEAVEEDDKDDEEDFIIKDNDNLLLVGHIEEESAVLEVYVFNKEEKVMYVHHDIVLPAFPLALEWLDFHPSDDTAGNYVAVGDMTPIIKIWDLDIVDILEPDYTLGKKLKESKMEKIKLKYHTDAVISLSWNKHVRNILASGSADSSIIIWDLQEAKPLKKLEYHTNKVQALQWHPFEGSFLLSGCTDGIIKLFDSRVPDTECKTWNADGEIEKVTWNLLEPTKFLFSTDQGFIHSVDMKTDKVEHSLKAHTDAVTGLDICPMRPNILVSASMDNTIKIWDLQKLSYLQTHKLKVGSIYTAKFAPDSELTLAVGGNNRSNSLKVMDVCELIDGNEEKSEDSISNLKPENEMKIDDSNKMPKIKKKKKQWNEDKVGKNSWKNPNQSDASTSYSGPRQNFKRKFNTQKNMKFQSRITKYAEDTTSKSDNFESNPSKVKKIKKNNSESHIGDSSKKTSTSSHFDSNPTNSKKSNVNSNHKYY